MHSVDDLAVHFEGDIYGEVADMQTTYTDPSVDQETSRSFLIESAV